MLLLFFQAEDGIRDATVTGVQTCALPIYAEPYAASGIDPSEGPACESTERFRCVELHASRTHNTIADSPPASQRPAASACRARSVSPTSRGDLPAPADHAPGFT